MACQGCSGGVNQIHLTEFKHDLPMELKIEFENFLKYIPEFQTNNVRNSCSRDDAETLCKYSNKLFGTEYGIGQTQLAYKTLLEAYTQYKNGAYKPNFIEQKETIKIKNVTEDSIFNSNSASLGVKQDKKLKVINNKNN